VTKISDLAKLYLTETNARAPLAINNAQLLINVKNPLANMMLSPNNLLAHSKEELAMTTTDAPPTLATKQPDVSILLTKLELGATLHHANTRMIVLNGLPITTSLMIAKMQFVILKPRLADLF